MINDIGIDVRYSLRESEIARLKARIALLEAAIRKHRGDVRASNAYGWPEDNDLYAVLQEDKP